MKHPIDLESKESQHSGFKGQFEKLLRRFQTFTQILTMIPMYLAAVLTLGLCLTPGVALFRALSEFSTEKSLWFQNLIYGVAIAAGFFLYGFSLLIVAPTINFIIRGKLKPWRGPYHSVESVKWYLHNGLTYLARFTFLEFVTPSPISIWFYRAMGMKVGHGVALNTTWISDPSLIELGDKVTIGGSVTLVAHYGQGGLLIIAPVKIGNKCTIGIKSTIMGGVTIGDGARVMPHSVVLPKTVIPPGETWGGVPAVRLQGADPKLKIA